MYFIFVCVWRRRDDTEEVIYVSANISITIPVGTHFQFRNLSGENLIILIVTSPVRPDPKEALDVPSRWSDTSAY
jgi:mannose-6-phosphate isomerase-like protein (cupin superfamily)